jgi:LCP family protein required for cell wall assembly
LGSDEGGQAGLYLIVPAVVLILPLAILLAGLRMIVPGASMPPVVRAPLPLTTIMVRASADDAASLDAAADAVDAQSREAEQAAAPPDLAWATEVGPTPIGTPIALAATPAATLAPPPPTATPQEMWTGARTFTFVVLGVDQRNEEEIPRTDTIMIGKADLTTPRVSLISVPRDLIVDIPGYGRDRINSAYVYGELYQEPGGGIGLLERTIEKNFGVSVDHFGLVDFQCFRTTVDAVGGVSVDVPKAIVDTEYPTDDYGIQTVRFDPGWQMMDGERALEYSRTRHADSDFQRMQRQQLVMAAVRDQVLRLRSLPALPSILSGCRNMRSDLGWRDYLDLATSFRSSRSTVVTFGSVDERMVVDTTLPSGAAVLLPRWEPIKSLFASAFGPPTTAGTGTTVRLAGSPAPIPSPGASPSPDPVFRPYPDPVASPSPNPAPPSNSVAGEPAWGISTN